MLMISLFTTYLLAILSIFAKKRKTAITFLFIGLMFCAYLLWFHATEVLNIRL